MPSSMQGADYVLATGRPMLYLGGFMGADQVLTLEELQEMVCQGRLRYVYWDAGGRGVGSQPQVSSWVRSTCSLVTGCDTDAVNAGASDGTGAGRAGGFQGPGGTVLILLYECQCRATAQAEGDGQASP